MARHSKYEIVDGEYAQFKVIERKTETNVYLVLHKVGNYSLGIIRWYPNNLQYCFYPESDIIWTWACLEEVATFIKQLMEERG